MIYSIFEGSTQGQEPTTLRLVVNKFAAKLNVSVVVVDTKGNIRPGGYLVTFNEDGKVSLVSDVSRDFGFRLDDLRRLIVT